MKVTLETNPNDLHYSQAAFQRCAEISAIYAPQEIMPEVLAVGDNFHQTGYPWLREQYIAGDNLGVAYLADPAFWTESAPQEIVRIIKIFAETHSVDITTTWEDKLAGMICPAGYEDLFRAVVEAGQHLATQFPTGHIIHGDLQFGNILVQRDDNQARLWFIDWEMSEVMPFGYELAMLYTFQLDQAIRSGNQARAAELERDIRSLVMQDCFDLLSYPFN